MKNSTIVGLGALAIIAAVVFNIMFAVLIVFMFIWNITDIQNVGPNFWNIFWLVLASLGALGIVGNFFRK